MRIFQAFAFIVVYVAIYVVVQLVSQNILTSLNFEVLFILNNVCTLALYWILLKIRKVSLISFCRLRRISQSSFMLTSIIGVALGTVIFTVANLPSIREKWPQIYSLVEFVGGGSTIWLTLLGTVLIGSLFEEILFRGLILNELTMISPVYIALAVQAILFGFILLDPVLGGFAAIGALIYGIIYWASDSLWASFITHVFSSGTIMLLFQMSSQWKDNIILLLFSISLVCLLVLLAIYFKFAMRRRTSTAFIEEVSQ